jgi:hypothetical protein
MELSFLTIVVSLAVCSLLVYAVFQYTKVRLNILEHSQKEQALILQEFIEESSTDIHRLYKLSGNKENQPHHPQGSIILEYANDHANEYANDHEPHSDSNTNTKQSTYNQPHIIHLDTAFFQNKRSNLIEISSDSEDTTTESGSDGDTGSDTGSDSDSSREDDGDSGSESSREDNGDSDSDSDSSHEDDKIHPDIVTELIDTISPPVMGVQDSICETESSISDIKFVTVDLGAIQQVEELIVHELSPPIDQPTEAVAQAQAQSQAPAPTTYSSMSVPELRQLLKEKYKQNPEKHPEIQKLKKAELIYALQTTHLA